MKRLSLLIIIFVTVTTSNLSCKKPPPVITTVNVSGLFSLSGNWSTLGINSKAALQLAADDINAYMQSKGQQLRLSVSFYDTHLNPDTAYQDFLKVTAAGNHFVIGPQSSAELSSIASLAEGNHVIVVSQGSTAGSLAIAGDPIFRFCPPDKVEGAAIANTIYNAGIRGLATIARNDPGNLGLQSATGASFISKGGALSAYNVYTTTTTDFTSTITSLKIAVNQLATTYGMANTAIYLASFDEGAALFGQAASDSVLSNVKWYGGDGIVSSSVLLANTTADDFAIKTHFFAPSFGLPTSLQSKWKPLADRITAITGIAPDAFALAAYDAMWVIANTMLATNGASSFEDVKASFARNANSYIGLTGSTALDTFGDRASGSFDYWGITKNGSNYQWTVVGESQ